MSSIDRGRRRQVPRRWSPVPCFVFITVVVFATYAYKMMNLSFTLLGSQDETMEATLRSKQHFLQGTTKREQQTTIPLLELLATNEETSCSSKSLELVKDVIPKNHYLRDDAAVEKWRHRIPPLIHVTAKSRCVLPEFAQVLQAWQQFPNHAFVLHNDAAMHRLLEQTRLRSTFAQLLPTLECTNSGAEVADLWRALVLWEYGGIYTDMDNLPKKFHPDMLKNHQAFFVIEQGGMLSQYFMAAKPRHPLMYLLLQSAIHRLQSLNQVDEHYVPYITGPGALKHAFMLYLQQQGPNAPFGGTANSGKKTSSTPDVRIRAGTYRGLGNSTVTVVGRASDSDEYVARNVVYQKRRLYRQMNMTHFSRVELARNNPFRNESCLERMYRLTET